ncbi:MAG: HNH endonuclease [Phycisphaerae bacterium]|nr:HNH endonuclease [Phycisphaerae bacterium]
MDIRAINGYPDYGVAADGSAYTHKKKIGNRWKITEDWNALAATIHHDGYRYITLYFAGKARSRKVSVLVCELFVGPKPNGPGRQECRHKNGNRLDDRADNLEWGSSAENAIDREHHGRTRRGENNGFAKLTDAQVAEIMSLKGKLSQSQIGRRFGISQVHAGRILNGNRRSA